MKKLKLICHIFLIAISLQFGKAQSSGLDCQNAILIPGTGCQNGLTINASQMWFKFPAPDLIGELRVFSQISGNAVISSLDIYRGDCDSLVLIDSDHPGIQDSILGVVWSANDSGEVFYVRLSKSAPEG